MVFGAAGSLGRERVRPFGNSIRASARDIPLAGRSSSARMSLYERLISTHGSHNESNVLTSRAAGRSSTQSYIGLSAGRHSFVHTVS